MTSTPAEDRHLVGIVPKNAISEIHVTLARFKGANFCDLRLFTELANSSSKDRVPTKKGFALQLTKLRALIQALQQAERDAQARGLLPPPEQH